MKRRSLYFTGSGKVETREEEMDPPSGGEVMIATGMSAISAGTEMLFFHDMMDEGMVLDTGIGCLNEVIGYPFKYGYCSVGTVIESGPNLPRILEDQLVFSFHPHESHFNSPLEEIISVPEGIPIEDAVFLPSMETALSLVMDARPMLGEKVVILGQGVIGLLTAALLSRMSPSLLVTLDPLPNRRRMSLELGADISQEGEIDIDETLMSHDLNGDGPDLIMELSGDPRALDQAIRMAGFESRIVVGSWYGKRKVDMILGEKFHRNRLRIVSSQVSNIGPSLSGRWDKDRRFSLAWRMIEEIVPSRLITHRFDIGDSQRAYDMIDREKDSLMQVVFTY